MPLQFPQSAGNPYAIQEQHPSKSLLVSLRAQTKKSLLVSSQIIFYLVDVELRFAATAQAFCLPHLLTNARTRSPYFWIKYFGER
jgi:hypothetical protein